MVAALGGAGFYFGILQSSSPSFNPLLMER